MGIMTQAEKLKRKNYRIKLQTLIESIGEWNINCLALSKEWALPESTVNRWKVNDFVKHLLKFRDKDGYGIDHPEWIDSIFWCKRYK